MVRRGPIVGWLSQQPADRPRLPFTGNTPPWTLVGHAHAAVRLVAAIRLVAAMTGDYLPSAENNDACAVTPTGCFSWGER